MIRLPFYRPPPAIGLAWSEDTLHVASLISTTDSHTAGPSALIPWPRADLKPADPSAMGTTLRQALAAAGIRSRTCIAALPNAWIMSATVVLPDLSAEDLEAFVEITAERSFPYAPDELQIVRSVAQLSSGPELTLLAVRRASLEKFQAVLVAAGLKPLGLTFGLPLVDELSATNGSSQVTLLVESDRTVLLATADQHVVSLRDLDSVTDSASALIRGLRLSWEQFSTDFRAGLCQLHVLGSANQLGTVTPQLAKWSGHAGIHVERLEINDLGARIAAAVARLRQEKSPRLLQFLPPPPTVWEQLTARFPRRRLGTLAYAGGSVLLLMLLALAWQSFTLWRLRDQWTEIQPQVAVTDSLQANIRQFRAWSDTIPENLSILKLISDTFPRTGVVTAKNIDIRDSSTVTITGTTTDNSALLETLDTLRQSSAVSGVKLDQIRGRAPAQFTFKFTWKGSGS
jgi:hypothetical protein